MGETITGALHPSDIHNVIYLIYFHIFAINITEWMSWVSECVSKWVSQSVSQSVSQWTQKPPLNNILHHAVWCSAPRMYHYYQQNRSAFEYNWIIEEPLVNECVYFEALYYCIIEIKITSSIFRCIIIKAEFAFFMCHPVVIIRSVALKATGPRLYWFQAIYWTFQHLYSKFGGGS